MERERTAWRQGWGALWSSRLVVWAAGVLGMLWIGRAPGTRQYDPAGLTEPYGYFGDLLAAPAARWDSVWFLLVAEDGYGTPEDHPQAAFFPLYPLLVRVVGWLVGSPLAAGVLVSTACFLGALVLLHRLAEIELGPREARAAVLLLAFFPASLFFSAVYSESLFLLLTVGAVLAGRQGRWAWAGALGALAALTRNSGILLLVPLALLFLYGPRGDRPSPPGPPREWWRPRHPPGPRLLWLGLIPAGLGAYLAYCAVVLDDALAPFHVQQQWLREFRPLGAAIDGVRAAWLGLRQLVHGPPPPYYFADGAGDALIGAGHSLMLVGFLAFAAVALVGALRRLPVAYGAYAAVALAVALSYPVPHQPLMSLPRFVAVIFPLFLWLARRCGERGTTDRALAVSAVLLGLLTVQFARWGFVA